MPEEYEFWDDCIKSCEPDQDLEGLPMVWLQFQQHEELLHEGLMLSISDLEHMLAIARGGEHHTPPANRPACPKCGNSRQVWVNQTTGRLTCHRAGCHIDLE